MKRLGFLVLLVSVLAFRNVSATVHTLDFADTTTAHYIHTPTIADSNKVTTIQLTDSTCSEFEITDIINAGDNPYVYVNWRSFPHKQVTGQKYYPKLEFFRFLIEYDSTKVQLEESDFEYGSAIKSGSGVRWWMVAVKYPLYTYPPPVRFVPACDDSTYINLNHCFAFGGGCDEYNPGFVCDSLASSGAWRQMVKIRLNLDKMECGQTTAIRVNCYCGQDENHFRSTITVSGPKHFGAKTGAHHYHDDLCDPRFVVRDAIITKPPCGTCVTDAHH